MLDRLCLAVVLWQLCFVNSTLCVGHGSHNTKHTPGTRYTVLYAVCGLVCCVSYRMLVCN